MSLNHAQTEAVAHNEGPCMVLAGPGSGKTLTIAKRIEYLIMKYKVRPEEILVITFTKYAAQEMKERTRRICGPSSYAVTFGTFHGIYYGILKWAYRLEPSNLLTDEEKYRMLRTLLPKVGWDQEPETDEEKDYLQELAAEIGNVKNNCMAIEAYEPVKYTAEKFRALYKDYEEEKKKCRKIDFEDMLIQCRDLFFNYPDILKKWQDKFRYILVDEFQDVNQAQYDVVRMLAEPQNNLFVVGDDDQSVYGFRGAKPGIMMEFMKDYPKAKRVLLDINYRSSAYIVNGALRVIGNNKIRFEKKIEAFQKADETVHVQEVKDPVQEAEYVLGKIKECQEKGIAYTDIAVLYRTNVDARAMSELMMEYQIPFVMKEHLNNIYEHFIAQDISSYFHLSQGEYSRKYFLQIANRPNRFFSRDNYQYRRKLSGKRMRYLHKNHKRLYLLVESEEEGQEAFRYLQKAYSGIQLVGLAKVSAEGRADDMLVNAINGSEVDCVLSALSVPLQEDFIAKNRNLLDARVWIGVGKKIFSPRKPGFGQGKIAKYLLNHIFRREMEKNKLKMKS